MTEKELHIVCFDVPFPVSHGGFFDLFYKIKALQTAGIAITLHCFEYGRSRQPLLTQYCKAVYYYPRRNYFESFSLRIPYIVSSRKNEMLIKNLSADNYPVLLEGTHCTYILFKNIFPKRKILYRLHNVEHIYYRQLFRSEKKRT